MTVAELNQFLEDFVDGFDFTRPGHDQSLARDVANVVVERIQDRSAGGVGPDGAPWPENSTKPTPWHPEGYRKWKGDTYGWTDPNYRTGQMLSTLSLGAATRIEPKRVTVAYGTNTPPRRSVSPTGYIDKEDEEVTDTEKATYAHEKGRPFMGLGEGDPEAVVETCQENLNRYILESPFGAI